MTEAASFSGRSARLLFGLLFIAAVLVIVILWVPIAACPLCGGDGLARGLPRLVLEARTGPGGEVVREPARKATAAQCRECDRRGKVSVLRKWVLLH